MHKNDDIPKMMIIQQKKILKMYTRENIQAHANTHKNWSTKWSAWKRQAC